MLNALLVAAALLSQTPAVTDAPPPAPSPDPPKWEVYSALIGGIRPDASLGGGGGALIGVNRRLTSWLRPEIAVGLGAYAGPGQLVTLIKIGTRLEWPNDARLKPYLWLAFAHNHEVGFDDAKRNPISSALGLSEDGVNHRSGIDTGLGLSLDLPKGKEAKFAGRLNARASMTNLLGSGPPRYVDLTVSLGLLF